MDLNQNRPTKQVSSLWVFGYGSLCWHPGFEYRRMVTGHVKGFARRFWQGNSTHRGTEEKPGRVATLVEDIEVSIKGSFIKAATWGCAYEVRGEVAMSYLDNRECKLGGYLTKFATFFPIETNCGPVHMPFPVILYIATPNSQHWLGDAPLDKIAAQIADSSGPSGHNVEYLLRLAMFMRDKVPGVKDDHLFILEELVKEEISNRRMCIKTLLGENVTKKESSEIELDNENQNGDHEALPRQDSFQFTSRVPEKKLRCLNI